MGLDDFVISEEEFDDPNSELVSMQTLVERGEKIFAPSKPAEFPVGITYRGPWETEWFGVQQSVRRHARALSKTGIPVWLMSTNHQMEYLNEKGRVVQGFADHTQLTDGVRAQVGHLLKQRHDKTFVAIEHRIFSPETVSSIVFPTRMQAVDPGFVKRVNASTILFTVFERSKPDPETKRSAFAMSNLGEIWVPCSRNRQVLIDSGVPADQVVVMPHPVAESDPVWDYRPHGRTAGKWVSHMPVGSDLVRLINVGKWEPRKGQHELIGAFLLAFRPEDACELVLKFSKFGKWENYPDGPQESIQQWLEHDGVKSKGWTIDTIARRVKLFGSHISRRDLVRFLAASHIYVSAGRAEGFDMPALDAKLLGLRLVVMGHGGAEDFVTRSDVLWDSPIESTHPGYGWDSATWAGYRPQDMAAAMFIAVSKERDGNDRIQIDPEPYTEKAVGQKMLRQCMALVGKQGGDPTFEPVEEYLNA